MEQLLWILSLLAGMLVLSASSGLFVNSLVHLGRSLKIKEYVLSFLIIGFAVAIPEYFIASIAISNDLPDIVFANAFGTSIVAISLIAGMIAIFNKKLSTKKLLNSKEYSHIGLSILLPMIFVFDGVINRFEGVVLLISYFIFMLYLYNARKNYKLVIKETKTRGIWLFTSAILALISSYFSADFVVDTLKNINQITGVSLLLITLTLLAPIGAIPELLFEFNLIKQKESHLSFGDLFTSVVTNTTFVIGFISIIKPLHIIMTPLVIFTFLFLTILVIVFGIFIRTKIELSRKEGITLVGLFMMFIIGIFWIYNTLL